MRLPLSWLRDFAPFDVSVQELTDTLNDLGMLVDGVERVGEGLSDVVVGRVAEIHPIEEADKIRRVLVDTGGKEPVEVVCGAWNFAEGDVVPFIPAGGTLPDGMKIEQRKMRGVLSSGMICSAAELGLGNDHSGILVLPPELEVGASFTGAMGVEPDVVFDLDIETNRPDALCVAGVARDLAARMHEPFAVPAPTPPAALSAGPAPSVRVDSPDLNPRFTATLLHDVHVGPSPAWMARRLTLAGMRPINNMVDISNYVMLELGQPTHPYDFDRLPGGGLSVRRAREGETVVTLDDVERELGPDDCLICDAEGTPVGIAGVMGGASSEISEVTSTVVLEAAWFRPMAVARTSKRLGLRSEASARFERGVDFGGVDRAVARYVELAAELAGAKLGAAVDLIDHTELPRRDPILLRTARVNEILGTDLTDAQVWGYLEPIGFAVTPVEVGAADVVAPTYRLDIDAEIHLIEEVARHHGYMKIPRTVPSTTQVGTLSPYQRDRRLVRQAMAGAGVDEAMTSLLIGPGDHARAGLPEDGIEADRPMIKEESILRTSLLPGLLRSVAFNASHRQFDVALFEVGHVFRLPDQPQPLPDEREHLSAVLAGQEAPQAKHLLDALVHALRLERVTLEPTTAPGLHPARTANVLAVGTPVGVIGEVDPDVLSGWEIEGRAAWLDIDLEALLAAPRRPEQSRPVSRYPSSDIDLAFLVDEGVPAGDVEATLSAAAGDLLESIELFDVFRGPQVGQGRRSLAYRLRFEAHDRTLTDAEVADVRQRAIAAVEGAHGAQLRG
jgi:phenylalanyl-tRNA synthetase beta chain